MLSCKEWVYICQRYMSRGVLSCHRQGHREVNENEINLI